MNKTYLAAIFTCFAITSQIQTLDIRSAFANDEKKFLEFVFIEQYNQKKAALNAQAKNLTSTAFGLILASRIYSLSKNSSSTNQTAENKPSLTSFAQAFEALLPAPTPVNAGMTLFTLLAGYKVYELCQQIINSAAAATVLTNFLQDWDINKEYTPANLHPFFNELVKIYEMYDEDILNCCALDIVSGLQFIIKRTELKVSEVYKKEFENNASGSTIFDTPKFLSEMLKHTKEIIKL